MTKIDDKIFNIPANWGGHTIEEFSKAILFFYELLNNFNSSKEETGQGIKHGEWLEGEFGVPYCSVCKAGTSTAYWMRYCPYCGAKMDLE